MATALTAARSTSCRIGATNSGAFYADYAARINQVNFTFNPYYGSANIGGTTDLKNSTHRPINSLSVQSAA